MKNLLRKFCAPHTRLFSQAIFGIAFLLASLAVVTQGQAKATPSDVYNVVDQTDRTLDLILAAAGLPAFQEKPFPEKGIKPMHVYQMAVSSLERIHRYEVQNKMNPVPIVIVIPRKYTPKDVLRLVDTILLEVQQIASHLGLNDLAVSKVTFQGRSPGDVFFKMIDVYMKTNVLSGTTKISPNEVYSQMVRAVGDIKSILSKIDPAKRYRIDVPKSPKGLKPVDVITECLLTRESINDARRYFGLKPAPIPTLASDFRISPLHVFLQSQVLISEINMLKMETGTISVTPRAIPVTGKTPSDAHQQVVTMKYLLAQIGPLEELVKEMESK